MEVNLDLLESMIYENYGEGPKVLFRTVKTWLASRGVKDVPIEDIVTQLKEESSIKQEDLIALRAANAELDALYAAGVKNWEGYEYAMEILND